MLHRAASIRDLAVAVKAGCRVAACVALLLLSACAAAPPYQSMSDARQAIDSADRAIAGEAQANALLDEARQALRAAERHLGEGDYDGAEERALEAREQAVKARERGEPAHRRRPR